MTTSGIDMLSRTLVFAWTTPASAASAQSVCERESIRQRPHPLCKGFVFKFIGVAR